MNPVIAEDVARAEIAEWAEYFETEMEEAHIKGLIQSVMRGRISLDQSSGSFLVALRTPIQKESGDTIDTVIIKEPDTGQFQKAGKLNDEIAMASHLIAAVSELPIGIVARIKQKDFVVLSGLLGFFG